MKKGLSIVTLLLIIFCGAIFSGCGPEYSSLSLSLNVSSIEMSINDEATDYFITIENYFDINAEFDFSFTNQVAKVVDGSVTDRGNGVYSFSIMPLVADSGTLIITLKGLDKPLNVPITITSEVTTITNSKTAYVWRGQTLQLNNSYFSFEPKDTKQTGVTFELDEAYAEAGVTLDENNVLSVLPTCTLDTITLTAISTYNATISCDFIVNIISEINTDSLAVSIASQSVDNENEFGEFQPIEVKGETPYEINLVVSETTGFLKKLSIAYDLWSKGYAVDVTSSSNISVGADGVTSILGKTQNFDFVVSAQDVGTGTITLKVYQIGIENNYKTYTINIKVTCKPKQIAVNGQAEVGLIELYTNGEEVKDYNFSIFPSKANRNDYSYAISFYKSKDGVTNITGDFATDFAILSTVPSKFVDISYGGAQIQNSELNSEHILNLADKLTSSLSLKAVNSTGNNFLAVKIDCLDGESIACSAIMYIKVYVGTTEFKINNAYKNGTIYMSLEEGAHTFFGIDYSEGSTPGKLSINAVVPGVSVCDIEQVSTANPYLNITPKNVGEQEFIITTPNNLSVVLKVVVVGVIAEEDFSLQIADTTNGTIASSAINATTNSLQSIVLKGVGAYVNITSQISKNITTNNYSYSYELKLTEAQKEYFTISNNSLITAKKFTKIDDKDDGVDLTVNLIINRVEAFQLIPQTLNHDYSINLKCVNYIKELTLYASSEETGTNLSREASVYNRGDLSYINQNLANVYLFMDLVQSQQEAYKGLQASNFRFTSGAEDYALISESGRYKVGEIGYFYFNYDETTGFIGNFTYDYSSIRTLEQITIIISLEDESTKTLFSSFVTINVEEYIDVDNIWLSTPTDTIYLDNTDTYGEASITVQIMPANAMCTDLDVMIDALNVNCISYDIIGNKITFTYQSAGSGIIRIFPVSKMKTNSYTDESNNYYYHLALNFVAADGLEEETALKISTYEDLRAINQNYHYYIDSTIDCQGKTLEIASLNTGSLRGTFLAETQTGFSESQQIGSIINFVLSGDSSAGNIGLIKEVGAEAKIYNLSISGIYKADTIISETEVDYAYKLADSTNIGFLCGTNKGTIKNVTVLVSEPLQTTFANTSNTGIVANVGLLAGLNEGQIIVNEDCKNYTLLVNNSSGSLVTLNFAGTNLTSYFGGIVGSNSGTIKQELETNAITIGLFGISANVFASTNATYMAGVAGENTGLISGIKITGELKSVGTNYSTYVAGFVAKLTGGSLINNTARVFVRGRASVSGFVGEVITYTSISENKVQAADDGTRKALDASLVVGYGETSEVNAISYTDLTLGVVAETYFSRSLPATLISILQDNSISDFSEVEMNSINYLIDSSLDKSYYYGDMVKVLENIDAATESVISLTLLYFNYRNDLTEGQEDDLGSDADFVLAAFLEALNSDNQINIANLVDSKSLLQYAGVFDNSAVKDVNLTINTPLVATIASFGKYIKLLSTGQLNITVSSSLNYQKSVNLRLYITNYYDGIKMFTNKDKTQEVSSIELVNQKTTIIYFDCYAHSYSYKNTPIEIVSNTQITFDYEIPEEYKNKFSVEVYGQTGFFVVTGDDVEEFTSSVTFISKYIVNNLSYYKNKANTIALNCENVTSCYAFVLKTDAKYDATMLEKETKQVEAKTGIEDIKLNKSVIEAEPSDSIEIAVTYESYNTKDEIVPTLEIYNGNGQWESYVLRSGKFMNSSEQPLFILEAGAVQQINGKYSINYTFKMCLEDMTIYNLLKNKQVVLKFSSSISDTQYATLTIQYMPENISSLLVINYNKDTNSGMISSENGIISVDPTQMLYSGKQISTGEQNILNAHVYTRYSEFDYVDVTLNLSADGGYLAAIEYEDVSEEGVIVTVGKISNNSVYTSLTNGATLRIYKEYLKIDSTNNTILISVLYKIPKVVADGTVITIAYDFYNNNSKCYSDQINLLSRLSDQVSFDIVGKEVIKEINDEKTYNVVRGKKYLLDTTIVGFTEDQVVFESSNPNIASISKEGTDYYLTITTASLNYEMEGYCEVVIRSYGQKKSQAQLQTSVIKYTKLHIYEILINDKPFGTNNNSVSLRMLETVDVRTIIADKIEFEYSPSVTSVDAVIKNFKDTFVQYSRFYFVTNTTRLLLTDGVMVTAKNEYMINCYQKDGSLVCDFTPLGVGEPCNYSFEVEYLIIYEAGVPKVVEIDEDILQVNSSKFECNVFLTSSADTPNPIYTYQDMLKMNSGEHYRQVNDITISANELQMIQAQVASFDGNGYKIKINSGTVNVALDSSSDFALFKSVQENAIIKNVSIVVSGNLTLTLNNSLNSGGANIALLIAENAGIITNCSITSTSVVTADIISTVSVMENSYFAALCAVNSGYITNCQVECNLTANGASLGGVVADNSGHISSTYIKNSRIYNTSSTTNENIVTGGFATTNSGTILMSYVEGSASTNRIYSDFVQNDFSINSKIIYTATKVAGFVYNNSGNIQDSYSNIPIMSSNSAAGFVGVNKGTIKRTYSLCKLKQQDTLNYGFVIAYDNSALFEDCFFVIQNNLINYNTSETNYKYDSDTLCYEGVIPGVEPLEVAEFDLFDKNGVLKTNTPFKSFITNSDVTSGVWFYAFNAVQNKQANDISLVHTYSCTVEGMENYKGEQLTFVARRLQLVAPNLVSYSQYNLIFDEDAKQGEYVYISSGVTQLGSKVNPYVITTAKEFEDYCYQRNNGKYEYFRLVADIDYLEEEIYSSVLYNKILLGYFEGNGLQISGYAVNSISSLLSAGLFSQLGTSGALTSCVKNTTFVPSYINLPNCIFVGGLAGTIVNANLYNITINNKDIVIAGNNVVGGLIGRAIGENEINMIYSNITAKASNYNALVLQTSEDVNGVISNIALNENGTNNNKVSYAGAIAGYIGGITKVSNAHIGQQAKSLAMIAGLMYGGIGSLATVQDFELMLNSYDNQIVSYAFGGLVAGEITGVVQNFQINSNILAQDMFSCYPVTPIAIGGVAGLVRGGKVYNLSSDDGYSVVGARIIGEDDGGYLKPHNPYIVKYVGGIIGYGIKIEVNNVNVGQINKNSENKIEVNTTNTSKGIALMGGNYVGGVVGYVNGSAVNAEGVVSGTEADNTYINSYVTNTNINIISTKTYNNVDGQQTTNSLYTSYVSAAVGENIDYYMDDEQHFGLTFGWSAHDGKQLLSKTYHVTGYTISNICTNNIVIEDGIIIYFAKYEKFVYEVGGVAVVIPQQMTTKAGSVFNARFANSVFASSTKTNIIKNLTFVMIDLIDNKVEQRSLFDIGTTISW
ncbi:MAG: hypothetical protein E7376_03275 [Clostridiales bacterium]|nr:hypothetical protein [Clostridiales bacterium]